MHIGSFRLEGNLLLAPMAGVTDRPFRLLCRRLGAGMATTEMITSNPALRGSVKTMRRMDFDGEPGPVSVQIVGSNPSAMAETARFNADRGAQIIDINMGCPAKKVCRKSAGSALLRDERLVGAILRAVTSAVDIPVTLKIRTGWDLSHRNGERVAQIAEQEGIAALAVHGRTRACGFGGKAEYETIRRIKSAVGIPVVANGDIDSPQKARAVMCHTGADGLMIGRAAQGRPWIFQEISHYLESDQLMAPPDPAWVAELLAEHLQNLYSFYGEYRGVRVARRHIVWYIRNQGCPPHFQKRIITIDSADEQLSTLRELFLRPGRGKELAA